MVGYLLKTLYLVLFSLVVICVYYFWYTTHLESFSGYTTYLIFIFLVYWVYKWYNLYFEKEEITFKPISIFLLFLLQTFFLSILFFTLNWNPWTLWLSLFFLIIWYMFLPILIVLSNLSFWKFLLSKIKWFEEETPIFQFLSSLWVWFFSFTTLLTIFWFLGLYNIYVVFWILILLSWLSYKYFLSILKSIVSYEIVLENHKTDWNIFWKINLNLLTTEFLFIVLTFLLSVNLINIVRPMPIWWDDLWVYMNHPQLMANAWAILNFWSMKSWEVFTWIWFMFNSAAQSFFLNNVWWILSVLVIILTLVDLLKSKVKTFINIPLLSATIFASMPMIIFQQAKDMKLDPWLFFVSVICLYMVIYLFLKHFKNKDEDVFSQKRYWIYFFIVWILAWFAFSIKITSLLLISWIIWVIFYSKLWLSGFFAYLLSYVWIFTKFGLWSLMNVVYPKDDIDFRNKVFIYCILLSVWFLAYSFYKHKWISFKRLLIVFWVFLLWVFSALVPWFAKNISTLWWNITVSWIINWKADSFIVDYSKIYSKEELQKIEESRKATLSSSWITQNEDMWRYFGYETWINNYIKLPYNLTMQKNQNWEYTDITYIFLAVIPVLILFLWYKYNIASVWYFFMTLPPFLFFFSSHINKFLWFNLFPDFSVSLTNIFSNISLPWWYFVLALFFLLPFLYLMYFLKSEKFSNIFKINLVFLVFYLFLWTVSAFWIVWYWIIMYYSFFLIISIWLEYVSWYEENEEFKNLFFKFFWSLISFLVIIFYFFNSSFPHWFTNLKTAWYSDFKAWQTSSYISIFDAHWNYFDVLLELNVAPEKRQKLFDDLKWMVKNQVLKQVVTDVKTIDEFENVLRQFSNAQMSELWMEQTQFFSFRSEVNKIRNTLYSNILYPKKDYQNKAWIYRIWTFLKYFISNNHNRLLEDSLVFAFQTYFYDNSSIDVWVDRMKKMWVNYFLVDLNAATIDKDPRKNLTHRYENLLKTFTSDKLELVSTDSLCLNYALERYKKSKKTPEDLEKYILTAWVNYESYDDDWKLTHYRWEKQLSCYNDILDAINEETIDEKNYPFLVYIKNYIAQNSISTEEDLYKFFVNNVWHGWMVLFKIK